MSEYKDQLMPGTFSRRFFVQSGLVVGFNVATGSVFARTPSPALPQNFAYQTKADEWQDTPGAFAPNGFIRIAPDGAVTFLAPNVEMGQGTHTGQAMLIAEELDLPLTAIKAVDAPPNAELYTNKLLGAQMTGGSTSTRATWIPLRKAAAAARMMLVEAAAQQWEVKAQECTVENGSVMHVASHRSLTYGALVSAASQLTPPADPPLKPKSAFKLIGKSQPRLDTPSKANGSAVYGIDVQIPGMKICAIKLAPVFGGKLVNVVENDARQIPGVRDILRTQDAVAVVADDYWAAKKALDKLDVTFAPGKHGAFNSAQIWDELRNAHKTKKALVAKKIGEAESAYASAATKLEAEYEAPFLAHATMEPLNCTVQVGADRCEIWVGTQSPVSVRAAVARITGLKPEQVFIHNHLIGGGFGRRLYTDFVEDAVRCAKQVSYPLKVIWSREEDIAQDCYRPAYLDRVSASLDAAGNVTSWTHHIYSGSVMSAASMDEGDKPLPEDKVDSNAVEGSASILYAIPNMLVDWTHVPPPVHIGWWRGVGPHHAAFVVESFIDELAHAAQADPLAFRRKLLANSPRALKVLDVLEEKSNWKQPLAAPKARGMAFHSNFDGFMAAALEISFSEKTGLHLERAIVVVDAGQLVNPNTLYAQIEGGLLFGLSAALFSEITFENGQAQQSNFNNYRVMRLNEAPEIVIHHIDSDETPGGIGEAATVAAPGALGNAIFAATGKRLRKLPVDYTLFNKKPSN